jgi:tetratricopeptide (TPR) repeat protein
VQPEKIGSIADGVQAQGLRDVLTGAEGLMRQQKFAEALQQYDVARQVAPNNALITMARANAELAASYYRRAETSLRDAVGRAPELVVAQFDLRGLVGEERLQTVVKDLKELGNNDPKQARPMLLLAYIAYNTGNEAQAGEYLAAAEQRAGGDDVLLNAWRRNWKIPAATAPAEPPAPAAPPAQPDEPPEPAAQPDGNK